MAHQMEDGPSPRDRPRPHGGMSGESKQTGWMCTTSTWSRSQPAPRPSADWQLANQPVTTSGLFAVIYSLILMACAILSSHSVNVHVVTSQYLVTEVKLIVTCMSLWWYASCSLGRHYTNIATLGVHSTACPKPLIMCTVYQEHTYSVDVCITAAVHMHTCILSILLHTWRG